MDVLIVFLAVILFRWLAQSPAFWAALWGVVLSALIVLCFDSGAWFIGSGLLVLVLYALAKMERAVGARKL